MEEDKINTTENVQENVQDTTEEVATFDPALMLGSNSDTLLLNPPQEKLKPKGYNKKQLKLLHRKQKLMNPIDIKYSPPLSYRYLRALAWISLAVSQIYILHAHSELAYASFFSHGVISTLVDLFADMSMPLFLVASFGYILNHKRSNISITISYFVCYIGIALAEIFILRRYVISIMTAMGIDPGEMAKILGNLLGQKVQVNVFADLFILTLFNLLMNWNPKKVFTGKKVIILRLLSILPLGFAAVSFALRYMLKDGSLSLPIDIYPFLTTKSPLVYGIFIMLTIWTKNREREFKKFGATTEDYHAYLQTKRNAFSFSRYVAKLFFWFALLDVILTIIVSAIIAVQLDIDLDLASTYARSIGLGQCIGIGLAIPLILLFSYKKTHKDSTMDIIIPVVGIGLCALVYVEGLYEIIVNWIGGMTTMV